MKLKQTLVHGGVTLAMFIGISGGATAAKGPQAAESVALTPAGEQLQKKYAEMLTSVRAELTKAVPKIDESLMAPFQKAGEALKKAEGEANAAQQALNKVQSGKALVEHAKGKWIGGAEKGIAAAEAALKKATTDAERETAKKELAKWQANKEDGVKALKERQEAYDKGKLEEPALTEANKKAAAALAQAHAVEAAAAKTILTSVGSFLTSDKLDAKLVKCAVLSQATPRGLAEFSQQGKEQETLVEKLLADDGLMKQMLVADGAKGGHYGKAMQIYTAIEKASAKSTDGPLHRLAIAIATEHAVPIKQSNPTAATDAPTFVDPVKRYLHYEKAFLEGDLDPAFKNLAAWEYRMVVDGADPDETMAWGRQMLRNYRPDHVYNPNYGWRYSGAVRTDVKYGSQDVKNDRPDLQSNQNIICNGGVCGRRAFFGRFMLRSFGIPTVARPQTGHAALAHWTPNGWVINLGAGWGSGRVDNAPDTDFLLMTQARKDPAAYLQVQRAQWAAVALGEQAANNKKENVGPWNAMVLFQKKAIVAVTKPSELAALGQELGEANESAEAKAKAVEAAVVTEADKKIVVNSNGAITIPAAAFGGAQVVKSFLGGQQLICGGGAFSCNVDVPQAGKYAITARVVTVHGEATLELTPNGAKTPVAVALPYSVGQWDKSKPVEVALVQGKNTLSFAKPAASFALKDITLSPVK